MTFCVVYILLFDVDATKDNTVRFLVIFLHTVKFLIEGVEVIKWYASVSSPFVKVSSEVRRTK